MEGEKGGGLGRACRNILSVIRGLGPRIHHSSQESSKGDQLPGQTRQSSLVSRARCGILAAASANRDLGYNLKKLSPGSAAHGFAKGYARRSVGERKPQSPVNPAFSGSLLPSSSRR